MTARFLSPFLALLLLVSAATGQVTARFYLSKDSYAVGEPLMFTLEVKNGTPDTIYLFPQHQGQCSDIFTFWMNATAPSTGFACGTTWDTLCSDDTIDVKAGETYAVQWPLDFWYRVHRPGDYEVSISRKTRFTTLKGGIQPLDVSAKLQLKVVEGDPAQVEQILNKFRADLQSADTEVRHNALDVLATTAPAYFYDDALRLARDEDPFNVEHAVGGLGRMNTQESRAVLAEVITTRQVGDSEAEESSRCHAIEALGMSGDTTYLSILLPYLDHTTTPCESWSAMLAVAQLGKGSVVPQLQAQLRNPDPTQRLHAIEALRITTSPDAVDALIGELRDKDASVRQKAASSLTDLTGHSVTKPNQPSPNPTQLENLWRAWWHKHRQDTTLHEYPPTVCRMS